MAGGGTAPKMKLSDVFILTGITVLFGALFMHAWVVPVTIDGEASVYTNGASMFSGDVIHLDIKVENETTLRFVVEDENGDVVTAESVVVGAGDRVERSFEAETSGFYTYEVDTKGVDATLSIDIERQLMLDLLPFPLGALFLSFGLYLRKEQAATTTESVLDAELNL